MYEHSDLLDCMLIGLLDRAIRQGCFVECFVPRFYCQLFACVVSCAQQSAGMAMSGCPFTLC